MKGKSDSVAGRGGGRVFPRDEDDLITAQLPSPRWKTMEGEPRGQDRGREDGMMT